MKKIYIAPCFKFETIDVEEMIMSSLNNSVVGGAPDGGADDVFLPGTSSGEPTPPSGGPIETDSKGFSGFFILE